MVLVGCGKKSIFTYQEKSDESYIIILNNKVSNKEITIPEKYNKKTITEIDFGVINYEVEKINIPKTISSISKRSFKNFHALKEVNVNKYNKNYCSIDGDLYSKDRLTLCKYAQAKTKKDFTSDVLYVQEEAFSFASLENITLPKVKEIGKNCFSNTLMLKTISLGKDLSKIDEAFCESGDSIEVKIDDNNITYKVVNNSIYTKDGKTLVCCLEKGNTYCLIKAEKISKGAFSARPYYDFIFEETVSEIDIEAFDGCQMHGDIYLKSNAISSTFSSDYLYIGSSNLFIKKGNSVSSYILENYTKAKETKTYLETIYEYYEIND